MDNHIPESKCFYCHTLVADAEDGKVFYPFVAIVSFYTNVLEESEDLEKLEENSLFICHECFKDMAPMDLVERFTRSTQISK